MVGLILGRDPHLKCSFDENDIKNTVTVCVSYVFGYGISFFFASIQLSFQMLPESKKSQRKKGMSKMNKVNMSLGMHSSSYLFHMFCKTSFCLIRNIYRAFVMRESVVALESWS